MNIKSTRICLVFIVVSLFSCTNKEQEQRLQESVKRLEQQNVITLNNVMHFEAVLSSIVFDDYTAKQYEYLQPSVRYFTENTKQFSELVSTALDSINTSDSIALFKQYQAVQQGYKFLRQKIIDSFQYAMPDSNINFFMSLDKNAFTDKYLSAKDSINIKLQLLFLQADAALNEIFFIRIIDDILSSSWDRYSDIMPMVTTDKLIYRRGDKLKLTAILAELSRNVRYAIIQGKQTESSGGVIEYSKKITEKPGRHELRFQIFAIRHGKKKIYPARVTYQVE